MRYVAYFFLLLLLIYFVIVKPYLFARNVEFHIEGLSIDLRNLRLGIKKLYFYYPSKERNIFIATSNALLDRGILKIENVDFVKVNKVVSKEPFDYDFSNITKRLANLEIKIDRIYISINSVPYKESIAIFINNTELRKGVLTGRDWARVYILQKRNARKINVLLNRAHVDGSVFYVDDATVVGDYFRANLKAKWLGNKGSFSGNIELDEIKKDKIIIAKTTAFAEGDVTYTFVHSKLKVYSPYVELIGKKKWKNVKGDLFFSYKLNEEVSIKGILYSQNIQAQVKYIISPTSKLSVIFNGFEVDNKLLSVDKEVSAVISGELELDPERKKLSLIATTSAFRYDTYSFGNSSLDLELDYEKVPKGKFYASLSGNGSIYAQGNFIGKDVDGRVNLVNFEYADPNVKLLLNYVGSFRYSPDLFYTAGTGVAKNLVYGGNQIGDFSFNFELLKDVYKINLDGEGLKIVGGGSLKDRNFKGDVVFENFNYSQNTVNVKEIFGTGNVYASKDEAYFNGKLRGKLHIQDVYSTFDGNIKIESEQGVFGSFAFVLKDFHKDEKLIFKHADLKGNIRDSVINGNYVIEGLSKGKFKYDVRKESYSVDGKVDKKDEDYSVSLDFSLKGKGENFSASLKGLAKYKGNNIPLEGNITHFQDQLKGLIKGFRTSIWAFDVKVDDAIIDGQKVNWKGLSVSLGNDEVVLLNSKSITFNTRNKVFNFEGEIDGSMKGYIKAGYDSKNGLKVRSEGLANMNKLSRIFRSVLAGTLEGNVYYTYNLTNDTQKLNVYTKEKISLISRYIGTQLFGTLDIKYNGQLADGKAKFDGDESNVELTFNGTPTNMKGTLNLKQVLLVYRSDSVRYRGTSDGNIEFKTNFEETNIAGRLIFRDGYLEILSLTQNERDKKEEHKNINLDLAFHNTNPLRIRIPEGYVVSNVKGSVVGKLYEPKYSADITLLGGKLTYFGKDFFIRKGDLHVTHEEKKMNITLSSPTPNYNIIMDVTGNINSPRVFLRSDPPRDQREILSALIGGGDTSKGIIGVDEAIVAKIPEFGILKKTVSNLVGTDININVSPVISGTETGVTTKASKNLTDKLSVEYQHSTIKNPKETYAEGSAKLIRGGSVSARIYSDQSKEVRIRIQKKFDFK